MAEEEEKKHPLDPEPPLGPNFPRLKHPDLDLDKTEEVDDVPNRDDVRPDHPTPPEPPD